MDDRDKDLTHLFVRDLDELPLPARGAWRPARGTETVMTRASRGFLTAAAVVAVIAIALIVGVQLNQRGESVANPSGSPKPGSTTVPIVAPPSATANPNVAPTPNAAASPASGPIYNDEFGFVVTDIGTAPTIQPAVTSTIRTESSGASAGEFTHNGYWVSPDGTLIAYWTPRSPSEPTQQLRIVRAANPRSLVAASGLSANESGGFLVWANDSRAVAYVVRPAPATTATIRTFNIQPGSSGPGQVVFQLNEAGKDAAPVAWDRAANLLAISVLGNGGFITEYIVADSAAPAANPKRTPVSGKITSMTGSSDAKLILGIDADTGPSYWPIANIASKVTPAGAKAPAVWRPGTHELGWVDATKLVLYSADQNATSGGFSGVVPGASIRTFRGDGSAVLLAVPGGAQTSYTLVLLGKRDPSPGDRVTFQATDGLRQSVRLR